MGIKVEIGLKSTPGNLERFFTLVTDDILAAIDRLLVKTAAWTYRETVKAFDTGRQSGGDYWLGNQSLAYLRYKRDIRGQNPPKPGLLTGAFRRSFGPSFAPKAASPIAGGKQIFIEATVPYAEDFVGGTSGRRAFTLPGVIKGSRAEKEAGGEIVIEINGSPPRPIFPVESSMKASLERIGRYEIGTAIRRHGGSGGAPSGGGGD